MRCTCNCSFPIKNQWMFAEYIMLLPKPLVALGSTLPVPCSSLSCHLRWKSELSVRFFHILYFSLPHHPTWPFICINLKWHLWRLRSFVFFFKESLKKFLSLVTLKSSPELLHRCMWLPSNASCVWWFSAIFPGNSAASRSECHSSSPCAPRPQDSKTPEAACTSSVPHPWRSGTF